MELRRLFKNDEFVIRVFVIFPKGVYDRCFDDWAWTLNNKTVDPKYIISNLRNGETLKKFAAESMNPFYGFKDIETDMYINDKYYEFNNLYLLTTTITSQELGIKFSDFQNLSIGFYNARGNEKPDFWQIKKENINKNKYVVNSYNNEAVVSIPEYFRFEFDEFGTNKGVITKNFDININFYNIGRLHNTHKLASLTGQSFSYDGYLFKNYNNALYYREVPPKFVDQTYENIKTTDHNFTKYQSISNFGINAMFNEAVSKIDNNLKTDLLTSAYSTGLERRDIYYDNYVAFNYKTGELENSLSANQKGLIVPYNFSGFFNTQYKFYFDDEGKNNQQHFTEVIVNNSQQFDSKLLDANTGDVQLKIEDKINDENQNQEYKYIFKQEQIEWIMKINDTPSIEMFNSYLKND
ncbi:MHO_1580 family protein [Mycoplasmopsis felifaucium]|uniref:MHO_1580 family protein n=1 Tax=Mycoplasmopsis felifaucium TaxID=35768 RepID=UPI0038CD4A3A